MGFSRLLEVAFSSTRFLADFSKVTVPVPISRGLSRGSRTLVYQLFLGSHSWLDIKKNTIQYRSGNLNICFSGLLDLINAEIEDAAITRRGMGSPDFSGLPAGTEQQVQLPGIRRHSPPILK